MWLACPAEVTTRYEAVTRGGAGPVYATGEFDERLGKRLFGGGTVRFFGKCDSECAVNW